MSTSQSSLPSTVKIATRKSKLALWQAEHVAHLIQTKLGLKTELVKVVTEGDKTQSAGIALSKIGGKGLFLKEIEDTMLRGEADIAVHSMKDVPSDMIEELTLAALLERENPSDALVGVTSIDQLKQGAVVGTSSLRRHAQILAARPDLQIKTIRGNVDTRLAKLDAGEYDATILATAGLKRLKLNDRIDLEIPKDVMLPAVAQGCVGIQCRTQDTELRKALLTLQHTATALVVTAERQCNEALGGSCHAPIAVHGTLNGSDMSLEGMVGNLEGVLCRKTVTGTVTSADEAKALGLKLSEVLFASGAKEILASHLANNP
ncbi:MAG TPA: hydroxymethylbilane synthase [Gammaproteobacteria bacterium]|nr:hydroxymethylbilane synthase [Gammaproteobacteria bacterium]HBF07158.1 hydroxymethylbilane synthase [Gammaproteobacteria bacterium]HCK93894.1 hydroxymethylbilane synthase [Gammaproteobacteria bacterium]|tara:strand:- start:89 stop:1045 length:957 start_codon:yes stop_codon:yes gene_type:complete